MPKMSTSATLSLPSLRTQPSYATLLALLTSLEIHPPTWTSDAVIEPEDPEDTKAINAWLPTIFRSDLGWFVDCLAEGAEGGEGRVVDADEQRGEIVELAAKRLAERCGRSATSDITRTWTVPAHLVPDSTSDLQIQIHEPGLTEGNTGHKTWGTAFAMIQQLAMLKQDQKFFGSILSVNDVAGEEGERGVVSVLELGSGTGLLGIAAAAIWQCQVMLTDLEVIVPNLKRNGERNLENVRDRDGALIVQALDWADHPEDLIAESFPIILASDTLYDAEQVELLASTIDRFLASSPTARALVAVPLRDDFCSKNIVKFEEAMLKRGFVLLDSAILLARDDFGDGSDEVRIRRDFYARRET